MKLDAKHHVGQTHSSAVANQWGPEYGHDYWTPTPKTALAAMTVLGLRPHQRLLVHAVMAVRRGPNTSIVTSSELLSSYSGTPTDEIVPELRAMEGLGIHVGVTEVGDVQVDVAGLLQALQRVRATLMADTEPSAESSSPTSSKADPKQKAAKAKRKGKSKCNRCGEPIVWTVDDGGFVAAVADGFEAARFDSQHRVPVFDPHTMTRHSRVCVDHGVRRG